MSSPVQAVNGAAEGGSSRLPARRAEVATPLGRSAKRFAVRGSQAAVICRCYNKGPGSTGSGSLAGAYTGYRVFDKSSCREVDKTPK